MLEKISGTTFRNIKAIPKDLKFVAEPNNKYDKKAVRVESNGELIGYLPKNSDAQKCFNFSPKEFKAKIVNYSFSRGEDELDNREFNQENVGIIASYTIDFIGKNPDNFYKHDGKIYERITAFIKRNEDKIFSTEYLKRLENWKKKVNHETLYKMSAERGTICHRIIEEILTKKGVIESIIAKNNLGKLINVEKKVYDDELMLGGTYDAMFENCIVDWKTSKRVQESHKLQVAFYAKCAGAKKAFIVALGANNKQKYSVCKLDKEQINVYYEKIKNIKLNNSI